MRWGNGKFALFAVAVLAASAVAAAPTAHAAEPTVETEVVLFWRETGGNEPEKQPRAVTAFFARVTSASGAAPTGSVSMKLDGRPPETRTLKAVGSDDEVAAKACGTHPRCSISNDITVDLGGSEHYLRTDYPGTSDTFKPSTHHLGLALGFLTDAEATTKDGEIVHYTFQLRIADTTPPEFRRPKGRIDFYDDQGHASQQPMELDASLRARWDVVQQTGLVTATANYPGGNDDIFLPIQATQEHSVVGPDPTPGGTTAPPGPSRTTSTTRRTLGRTPTTAALAPINPSPETTLPGETPSTIESFGDFVTSPPTTGSLSAVGANNDEGPPIAVVATTLLALAALGGGAAYRRYRRGGVDWF